MEFLQLIPWWGWLIAAGLGLSLLAILAKIFNSFAELLKLGLSIITGILKLLWAIVSAPFRFIAWIIRRAREKKLRKENNYAKEKEY